MSAESPTPHAQPFYCPYCGEQDLRPGEEERTFHCRTCDRLWRLQFLRLGAPATAGGDAGGSAGPLIPPP